MNKTIASFALLKVNWDTAPHRQDYLGLFVPFIISMIHRRKYVIVDVNAVCADFATDYGLVVPYHPMLAILTQTLQAGYLTRRPNGDYLPVKGRIVTNDFTDIALEQERKFKKVVESFLGYCHTKHGKTLSAKEAEDAFIGFLKDHDLDILFINQELDTLLPEVSVPVSNGYLINSFVRHAHTSDPEIFSFVLDISIGHIIAGTILYRDFDRFRGNVADCDYYLDTGILFSIMGINGDHKQAAYKYFLQLLNKNNAKLFVFQHTFDEFMGILEGCRQWVENAYFDPLRASQAANFFVENGYTASDVEEFILLTPQRLAELRIEVVGVPAPMEHTEFQIDENKLTELIVDVYKAKDRYFDETEKEFTIQKDVRSIAAIYKLRKGSRPIKLPDAKCIFVTTNSSLAYASRLYEIQTSEARYFFIPATLTDVFVGTLIWLQSPTEVTAVNEKSLIANCYAAMQPTRTMVKKVTETADRLRLRGEITDNQVTLLKQSGAARNLLQEETLGDSDRFTDKTAIEILREMRSEIRQEERDALQGERMTFKTEKELLADEIKRQQELARSEEEKRAQAQDELIRVKTEKEKLESRITDMAEAAASTITRVFYVVSTILAIAVSAFQFFPNLRSENQLLNYVLIAIAVVLSSTSLVTGFNFKGLGQKMKAWLKTRIANFLRGNVRA